MSYAYNFFILVQLQSCVMYTLILVTLVLRFPFQIVSMYIHILHYKVAQVVYNKATVVVLGLNFFRLSFTAWRNSDLMLAEGYPASRVQEVVLSTNSTAMVFAPFCTV